MSEDLSKNVSNVPTTDVRNSVSDSSLLNPSYTGPTNERSPSLDIKSPAFLSPIISDEIPKPSELFTSPKSSTIRTDEDATRSAAIVPISRHTSISQEDLRISAIQIESEDEMTGQTGDSSEKTPLLNISASAPPRPLLREQKSKGYAHTQAYQKAGNIPVPSDYDKLTSDSWPPRWPPWCVCCSKEDYAHLPSHPITAVFTNESFRQAYAGKIFQVKALQFLVCFLVAILAQMTWNADWNDIYGTPAPVLIIAEHRWIPLIPFGIYVVLIAYIRFVSPEGLRKGPWDKVVLVLATIVLAAFAYALSVGFADVIHAAVVPVTFGSLLWSYFMFQRVVTLDVQGKFYVDVRKNAFYYAVAPMIVTGTFLMWPIVFTLLMLSNSAVLEHEDVLQGLLVEGLPVIGIGGIILLLDVNHIRGVFNGNRISIITEDQSEVVFASFFV